MFKKSFRAQILFLLSILALNISNTMRVLEGSGIRSIQVLSLIVTGMLLGALLVRILIHFRQGRTS